MKILQINTVCGTGSTGRIVTDLYGAIRAQGGECLVVYGRGRAPEGIDAVRISTDTDNRVHGILTRLTDKHGFGSAKSTAALIEKINAYEPDIIHLHNIHGYYINIEILFHYIIKKSKPVVWTLHDCWPFTGHCAYFDYANCSKWRTGCFNCPQKRRYPSSILLDNSQWNYLHKRQLFTGTQNMTMVCPSNWLANLVKQSFLGKYPVKVINNGIDLNVFKPAGMDSNERNLLKGKYGCADKFVILGAANVWEERKGLKYLTEAADKFNDCQVIVVGVNQQQKQWLPSHMTGIMRTNNVQELAKLYSIADVFVNPTLEDNYPTTNMEALACGTPVITFNTGGSPESLDAACGIIVEKGNTGELLRAIEKIRREPISREACLRRAQLFNKDNKFLEYLALYKQILQ